MGEITTDKVIDEINRGVNYAPDWNKLYPKNKTALEEVKTFSNALKFVVDDYGLMRDAISIIYHTIKEDNIDIDKLYFRFTDNEVRVMVMEILSGIVELKKRKQ